DLSHLPLDAVHPLIVARRVNGARHAAAGEQVLDLADGDHGKPRGFRPVEERFLKRRQRVVVPVGGTREAAWSADEGPRNYASDAESLADQLVGDFAGAVQLR